MCATALLAGCPGPQIKPPAPVEPAPTTELPPPPPVAKAGYPENIALLLPLSGRQRSASIIVRDGFLSAWYRLSDATGLPAEEMPEGAHRPNVRVYDIGEGDVAGTYMKAVDEGAQFIVGPLVKEEVATAAGIADGKVPTLALNFLEDDATTPPAFFQFALSPEDEAQQVAERLVADKRPRGVALVPSGDWGQRVLGAFEAELTTLGGELIARGTYEPGDSDHSPTILRLLRLTDSRERHQRLTSALGTRFEFQPRRRGDIDFIFVAGQPYQGRQIRPQLRFHFAGDIPMYSLSDIFQPDETANIDLDGTLFPDMPWMLTGDALTASMRDSIEKAWPSRASRRGRLYAFGVDAYRLIPMLRAQAIIQARNKNKPRTGAPVTLLNGTTGELRLDNQNRIHRELDWALVRDGKPRTLQRIRTPR